MLSELPIPGTLKRLDINYYTRCLLYSAAETLPGSGSWDVRSPGWRCAR